MIARVELRYNNPQPSDTIKGKKYTAFIQEIEYYSHYKHPKKPADPPEIQAIKEAEDNQVRELFKALKQSLERENHKKDYCENGLSRRELRDIIDKLEVNASSNGMQLTPEQGTAAKASVARYADGMFHLFVLKGNKQDLKACLDQAVFSIQKRVEESSNPARRSAYEMLLYLYNEQAGSFRSENQIKIALKLLGHFTGIFREQVKDHIEKQGADIGEKTLHATIEKELPEELRMYARQFGFPENLVDRLMQLAAHSRDPA